jgi:hypothetical protein
MRKEAEQGLLAGGRQDAVCLSVSGGLLQGT